MDQSQLRLTPGKTLSLVGGDIEIVGGTDRCCRGYVRIRAGALTIAGSALDADNTADQTGTGGIDVMADTLAFTDSRISASAGGTGPGGTVAIKADTMAVRNSSTAGVPERRGIDSDTRSSGNAGAVNIRAGSLTVAGSGAGITSDAQSGSTGKAGSVTINADTITLSQGGGTAVDAWAGSNARTVNIQPAACPSSVTASPCRHPAARFRPPSQAMRSRAQAAPGAT